MKKAIIIIIPILLIIVLLVVKTGGNKDGLNSNTTEAQPTKSVTQETTPTSQPKTTEDTKIIPTDSLCPQISKEFVTQATGVTVVRVSSINDVSINACDYYLSSDNNSPYIAVIVNKNLNFEKHKQIAQNNSKFVLKTDPNILGNHYVVWADNETRIVNINLYLSENSFLRVDKNVERAIDNDGLIKLASALSKRL